MIPSMDMETTSDEKALTLAATSEQTWPASRQMTCTSNMEGKKKGMLDKKTKGSKSPAEELK